MSGMKINTLHTEPNLWKHNEALHHELHLLYDSQIVRSAPKRGLQASILVLRLCQLQLR